MPEPGPQTPCPRCGSYHSRVIGVDRELRDATLHTTRRRRCRACRGLYTTIAQECVRAGSYSSRTISLVIEIHPICRADIPST